MRDPQLESEVATALTGSSRSASPLSANSRKAYVAGIWRFFEAAGVSTLISARKLDAQAADRAVDSLAENYSPATARQAVAAANRLYRHWAKEKRVSTNPLKEVGRIVGKTDMDWNVLQPGESEKLLAAVANDLRNHAILTALIVQGWRVDNLCSLNWSQLARDSVRDVVVTLRLKRNKTFKQEIKKETLAAAAAWANGNHTPTRPFIAADVEGQRLHRFEVWKLVCRLTKQHIGRRVTPHGLRATCISTMIERKGIDAARRWAGHESIVTTMKYSRFATIKDK